MLFYYVFLVIALIFLFREKKDFITFLPAINVVLDSSFSFFPTLSIVTYFRPLIYFILFYYFINKIKFNTITKPIFLFLIYTLVLVFFSTNLFYSVRGYLQVFISMMTFVIGFIYFDNRSRLDQLNKSILFLLIFSVGSSVLGYSFGIGKTLEYTIGTNPEVVGLLGSSGLYTTGVAISLLPVLNTSFKKLFWRWILFAASILAYIFILLNMRRTAIVIPIVGFLSFLWFTPKKSNALFGIIIGLGVLILLSPYYVDKLIERYEIRAAQGRFEEDFYKTEGRYQENIIVYENTLSFKNPVKSLFGSNIYTGSANSEEDDYWRGLHSDPAVLMDGAGIIGLIIYIFVYIRFLQLPGIFSSSISPNTKLYKSVYFSLIIISLFVSLNGSLQLVSIRTLIFLYMGAMLSLMSHSQDENLPNTSVTKAI